MISTAGLRGSLKLEVTGIAPLDGTDLADRLS
jgi:hypothetical protein